jgi:hypothetical protein
MGRTRLRGLSIAGIGIGLEVPEICEWDWPESALRDYVCPPHDPEVHVGLRIAEVSQADLAGERYFVGAFGFEVARRGDDWLVGLSRGGKRRQLALFDGEFRVGEVLQSPEWAEERRYPLGAGLDEWIVLQRTVARGGLCVSGRAVARGLGAEVTLGAGRASSGRGWCVATPSLLGRQTLVLREEESGLRLFRTPWCGGMDDGLPHDVRVLELRCLDESDEPYRESLDPNEAAEELVGHAVLPLCDERFLERVLRNAKRISDGIGLVRLGQVDVERERASCPPAAIARGLVPLRGLA